MENVEMLLTPRSDCVGATWVYSVEETHHCELPDHFKGVNEETGEEVLVITENRRSPTGLCDHAHRVVRNTETLKEIPGTPIIRVSLPALTLNEWKRQQRSAPKKLIETLEKPSKFNIHRTVDGEERMEPIDPPMFYTNVRVEKYARGALECGKEVLVVLKNLGVMHQGELVRTSGFVIVDKELNVLRLPQTVTLDAVFQLIRPLNEEELRQYWEDFDNEALRGDSYVTDPEMSDAERQIRGVFTFKEVMKLRGVS